MENLLKKKFFMVGLIIFGLQALFYITGYINGNTIIYFKLISVYCGTIAISLAIITIFLKNGSFYKYLGISFLGIGLLEYLKIMMNAMVDESASMNIRMIINYSIENFEYTCLLLAVIYAAQKIKNIVVIIKILIAVTITVLYTSFFLEKSYGVFIFLGIGSISFLIVLMILRRKGIKDYKIYTYMLCILVGNLLKIIFLQRMTIFMTIPVTLKMLAYYNVYQGVSEKCIAFEINNIKEKVKTNKKEKKQIYNKIKTKRNVINELENMKLRGETYYYKIIDGFSDGIFIYDENLKYLNKRAKEILYTEEENIENIKGIRFRERIHNIEINGREVVLIKDKYGKKINIEIYKVRLSENIKIIYFKEVNEIIEYEKALRRYKRFLEYETMKNKFYANISHELRTPINIITTALELNEIKINNNDFEGIQENNLKIKKNCLRLIRTINNFIDANKFTEGCVSLHKKNWNIVEVVEETVFASVPYIREKGLEIIFDSTDEEIIINIDRDMIERVILNLLSNSLKYGKQECEKIDIEIVRFKKKIYIVVSNNGEKIRKTDEKYIFEKFSSMSNKLNRENEGSGLGLFLCREIIRAHGGEFYLSTENESKNEFVILLKVDEVLSIEENRNHNINGLDEKVKIEFADIN
ncbi:HAMP domain-containing sensor histidine kinase [uncultured Clostridium sp.]|uniref:sensor histidine kinase n=1 Tax=uncultured Clostridium sp. TaxID=59620 RepID=UPI00262998BA|nr:HAMP domain-containing sensor histidine kinase [uncultured Clostridium sp.]